MTFSTVNRKGVTYYLHSKEVQLRNNRLQRIYYFAKKPGDHALNDIPAGYEVVESERTGLPILRRKKNAA